ALSPLRVAGRGDEITSRDAIGAQEVGGFVGAAKRRRSDDDQTAEDEGQRDKGRDRTHGEAEAPAGGPALVDVHAASPPRQHILPQRGRALPDPSAYPAK